MLAYQTHNRWHFFFQENSPLLHMHCACNTVQLLRHSRYLFSWTMPPNSPELNALITRYRESYSSVGVSLESKRLKKSRSDWLNSGNALIQHFSEKKCDFQVFPRLPGSVEAQVIWGGTVKRLLIIAALWNRAGHYIFALWFLSSSIFFSYLA